MELKFIKYKPEQVNLAQIYCSSEGGRLDELDVRKGTLVIGYTDNGKTLAMGYLRNIIRSDTNDGLEYEIVNAVEGMEYLTFIENACKPEFAWLPYMVAFPDSATGTPKIGKVIKCNGKQAIFFDGGEYSASFSMDSIYQITPYFKETK